MKNALKTVGAVVAMTACPAAATAEPVKVDMDNDPFVKRTARWPSPRTRLAASTSSITVAPGTHGLPAYSDPMYALVRIGVKSGDAEDLAEIHRLQDRIKLSAVGDTPFEAIAYDEASYLETHQAILDSFAASGLFGCRNDVRHRRPRGS